MPKSKLELLRAKRDRMSGNGERVPQDLLDEIEALEEAPVITDTRNSEAHGRTRPVMQYHPLDEGNVTMNTMMEEIRVDWPQSSIDMFLKILRTHPHYQVEVIERFRTGRGDSDRKYGTLIIRAQAINTF